jgi:hypothetical protein
MGLNMAARGRLAGGVEEGGYAVRHGLPCGDDRWDDFLVVTSEGRFQQSTPWAKTELERDWQVLRLEVTSAEPLVGGVQLLWREGPLGRVGWIDQGPVIRPGYSALPLVLLLRGLTYVLERHHFRLVLVHPGILATSFDAVFTGMGFLPLARGPQVGWRMTMDVGGPLERLRGGLASSGCRVMRGGREFSDPGGRLCERGEGDLGRFVWAHSGASPVSASTLLRPAGMKVRAAWQALRPRNWMRFHTYDTGDRAEAGCLSVVMGTRLTVWRTSLRDSGPGSGPGLACAMMEWAHANGIQTCEFPMSVWTACSPHGSHPGPAKDRDGDAGWQRTSPPRVWIGRGPLRGFGKWIRSSPRLIDLLLGVASGRRICSGTD